MALVFHYENGIRLQMKKKNKESKYWSIDSIAKVVFTLYIV